jgi:DNA polymerase Ligase (LigD)
VPRFVLLEHDHPTPHLDLMLEADGVLWSWRLDTPPHVGTRQMAERIGDHRTRYLDYEGPVSGGRGQVVRHDRGIFEWIERQQRQLVVRLEGEKLRGVLELREENAPMWTVSLAGVAGSSFLW